MHVCGGLHEYININNICASILRYLAPCVSLCMFNYLCTLSVWVSDLFVCVIRACKIVCVCVCVIFCVHRWVGADTVCVCELRERWARASCPKAICYPVGWRGGDGPAAQACPSLIDDLHSPGFDQVTTSHYWPPYRESSITHTTHTQLLLVIINYSLFY